MQACPVLHIRLPLTLRQRWATLAFMRMRRWIGREAISGAMSRRSHPPRRAKGWLSAVRRRASLGVTALWISCSAGCGQTEPVPSHHADLGTDGMLLLPPASAWHDAGGVKGQAEWAPFRKPGAAESAGGGSSAKAPTTAGDGNAELRDLIAEYKAGLTDEKYDELADFFVKEQSDALKPMLNKLRAFADTVKALKAVFPDEASNLDKLAANLAPGAVLKLDIESLKMTGKAEAVAKLRTVATLSFLPNMPPAAQTPREVRFTIGEEDYWYIELPVVSLLSKALPAIQGRRAELDKLIADKKSEQLDPDFLREQTVKLGKMTETLGSAAGDAATPGSTDAVPPDGKKDDEPPTSDDEH